MRIGHCLATLLVLAFGAGCTTITHTPKDYKIKDTWPTVRASGPVEVRSGNARSGRFEIELAGQSMSIDLQEYTEALAQRVRAALADQGVAVETGPRTAFELEVVYANILPQIRNHCVVDFTVRADNGYVRGHQARAKSGDAKKACNAALSEAALEMLADEILQRYMAGAS